MRVLVTGLLLALYSLFAMPIAAQTVQAERANDPMAQLSWLVGDWHSTVSAPLNQRLTSKAEARFGSALGGKLLTISMTVDGHDFLQGMFAYDGAKKSVAFWYVIADPEGKPSEEDGTVAAGLVKNEQGYLFLDFIGTRLDGVTGHFQTRIARVDEDHCRWAVFVDYPGEGIQKLNELVFARGV